MPKRKAVNPWEQQDGESAKAFEAFATYRDLGPERSIAKTSQKLVKNSTTLSAWSAKYKWVERARDYDRELDRQAHEQKVQEVRRMSERHIKIAMKLQEKAIRALNDMPADKLNAKMLLEFIDKATALERLNRMEEAGLNDNGQQAASTGDIDIVIEGDDNDGNETDD